MKLNIRRGTKDDWPLVFKSVLLGLFADVGLGDKRNITSDGGKEWVKARDGSPISHGMPKGLFLTLYHDLLESVLERSELRVAEALDSPQRPAVGFLLLEQPDPDWSTSAPAIAFARRPVLHYAYVKRDFRHGGPAGCSGVFTQMLGGIDPNSCDASHFRYESSFLFRRWPQMQYNPFRVWPRWPPVFALKEYSRGTATTAEHEARGRPQAGARGNAAAAPGVAAWGGR